MPSGAEGFDTNGRPDDLLKRITYNANNYGKGAFLFADADAGPEDESRARRNRFPKRENLELEQKLYETMERQGGEGEFDISSHPSHLSTLDHGLKVSHTDNSLRSHAQQF